MANHFTGLIAADEAYSKAVVLERLGVSQKFWDKMLDDGLPFTEIGHTRWVTGRNLIDYLSQKSETKQDSRSLPRGAVAEMLEGNNGQKT
jgi:hypothetical protein